MTGRRARAARAALGIAASVTLCGSAGHSQVFEMGAAWSVAVGAAPNGSMTERVDAARTGRSRTPLPTGGLRSLWRTPVGAPLAHGPAVDAAGTSYTVSVHGETAAVAADGTERWRVSTGGNSPASPALMADTSVLFVDDAGEAIDVAAGRVRWKARFGRAGSMGLSPLPLDDGGAIVATSFEVAALDASGQERARMSMPEARGAVISALVSALGRAILVTTSGVVWGWTPGTELVRMGAFEAPLAGPATLVDLHTLVAVAAGGSRLLTLDLTDGHAASRLSSKDGMLGVPCALGGASYVILETATREMAVVVDRAGVEWGRAVLRGHSAMSHDAGAPALFAAAGAAVWTPRDCLVDAQGTLAFTASDGSAGVVAHWGTATGGTAAGDAGAPRSPVVEVIADACPDSPATGDGAEPRRAEADGTEHRAESPFVGLAPLPPRGFVVACRSGALVAIQ